MAFYPSDLIFKNTNDAIDVLIMKTPHLLEASES
jgi:hypothetical protein